jgi:hypothetical protein
MLVAVCVLAFLFLMIFLHSICGVIAELNVWAKPISFKWSVFMVGFLQLDIFMSQQGITRLLVHTSDKFQYAYKVESNNTKKL